MPRIRWYGSHGISRLVICCSDVKPVLIRFGSVGVDLRHPITFTMMDCLP